MCVCVRVCVKGASLNSTHLLARVSVFGFRYVLKRELCRKESLKVLKNHDLSGLPELHGIQQS